MFVAGVILAVVGYETEQIVGFAVAVLALVFVVGGVPTRWGARAMSSTWRGRSAVPPEPEVLDEAPADPAAWQREREHRERASAERETN